MYIYFCVYVYMYMDVCVCVFIHTYIYISHTRTHAHTHTYIHTCIHTYTYIYIRITWQVKAEEQRLEDKQEKKNDVWVATDAADAVPVYKTKRFVKQQHHKSLLDAFDRKVFGGTAR
jgi:hypothetical protein